MWRVLLNFRVRLEIVTAEYITEILFRYEIERDYEERNVYTYIYFQIPRRNALESKLSLLTGKSTK